MADKTLSEFNLGTYESLESHGISMQSLLEENGGEKLSTVSKI